MQGTISLENIMKVKINQLHMMKLRGYDVDDESILLEDSIGLVKFMTFYDLQVTRSYEYSEHLSKFYINKTSGKPFYIYYALATYGSEKCYIPQADIQIFLDKISTKRNCSGGIIISPKFASNNANTMLQSSSVSMCYNIQHFITDELMYNPLNHVLVPEHVIMTKEQKDRFYKENKTCKPSMMPIIKIKNLHVTSKNKKERSGDIISKWLGVKHDDLIMIYRENMVGSGMTDRYVVFRRVETC